MSDLKAVLERIAVALERIAESREAVIADAVGLEKEESHVIREVSVGEILDVVSAVMGLDVLEKRRDGPYLWGRYAAMTAIRERLHFSLPVIGRELGVDHTTVLHGLARFAETRATWTRWDVERWEAINSLLDRRTSEVAS